MERDPLKCLGHFENPVIVYLDLYLPYEHKDQIREWAHENIGYRPTPTFHRNYAKVSELDSTHLVETHGFEMEAEDAPLFMLRWGGRILNQQE